MSLFLVSGATGNTGGPTVDALLARGERVRAISRRERDWPDGVEGFAGDIGDPDAMRAAAEGVDGAYLLSGYAGLDAIPAALAEREGTRVVLLSSGSLPDGGDNPVTNYHRASEEAVRGAGVAATVLRPNSFMSNALRWNDELARGDVVHGPFGDVPIALNDPRDLAEIAARALTTRELAGETLRVSGPEALTPGEQVEILGAALGRPLRFEGWSDDEAREHMAEQMPAEYVEAFFSFFRGGGADETTVRPTIERVLGRPPGTFAAWARAHADRFRSSGS